MAEIKPEYEYNYTELKMTFDNVYGELEFFKKKCEILEKDVFKSQTQIKKLESNLKKCQEMNALHSKVIVYLI